MTRKVSIRRGAYADSVSLMQISRELSARSDVITVQVGMATELNVELLTQLGFEVPDEASPNDMVVAIEADSDDAVASATSALDEALVRRPEASGGLAGGTPPPPTIGAAARRGQASLALVSTPGRVAAIDAADALGSGLDVMVFSDNVPLEHEVALKTWARDLGRLVMGPDCGTAVVDGVGLGFANVVRPGPIGIVAASGTGAQHLMCLLDGVELGVTHCLGVGGRDLSRAVGGLSTLTALDRLDDDDHVESIVVLSKPPAQEIAARITAHAASLRKPVVECYLGADQPDITATAQRVAELAGVTWAAPRRWGDARRTRRAGAIRGLFAGGTLCDEAMLLAVQALGTVASNIPLTGQPALGQGLASDGHTFIDFGDDQLTAGRPHPMIDPSLRLERLERELADDECAVVLLDVVLGHGAHPDPSTDLADVIQASTKPVVVSLVGSRDDPQGTDAQANRLADAGAVVHASNAAATREALTILAAGGNP